MTIKHDYFKDKGVTLSQNALKDAYKEAVL